MQKRKEAPKRAILDLRQQLDMLQKRERHLENQMAEQDVLARKYVATNKTGTLHTCLSSMDPPRQLSREEDRGEVFC